MAFDAINGTSELNEHGNYVEHAPQFTHAALVRVYVLVALGIISLVGNVAILFHIAKTRSKRRNSRHTWSAIYTLILHLSIADLLVTVFCIFGEAAWSYTVEWLAGELACKFVKWFQMFALYLSTYVLVLIGIDRWVAVKYPMKSLNMAQRCYRLLIFSYILSLVMSLPQVSTAALLFIRFPFILCISSHSVIAQTKQKVSCLFEWPIFALNFGCSISTVLIDNCAGIRNSIWTYAHVLCISFASLFKQL